MLIFLAGLALRAHPLSRSGNILIGADGYYHFGTVRQLLAEGSIPKIDPLSYGGREHIYAPGFHLLASAFTLLSAYPAYRVVVYFSFLFYFFSFLVCHAYAERRGTSGPLACLFLATLPVYVWRTTSNFLPEALWGFLAFSVIFLFSSSRTPIAVLAAFALAATHSIALIVLPIFAFVNRKNLRLMAALLVAVAFAASFWTSVESVYQNVPIELRGAIFEGFDLTKYVSRSGLQGALALLALPSSGFPVLLWFAVYLVFVVSNVLEIDRAIGVSALLISEMAARIASKFGRVIKPVLAIIVILWAFARLSDISWAYVPGDTHSALLWSRENTPPSATIASLLWDSYWVEGIAERKNIMDGHFAGISDVDVRYGDAAALYKKDTTDERFFQILVRYRAKYILDTLNAKNIYGFTGYPSQRAAKVFDSLGARVYYGAGQ